MATIIDSLVVKLGLDSKDFERGEKRVVESLEGTRKRTDKIGKDVQESGRSAAEFFGQMQKAAIKFFAVLTVGRGLAGFTRDVVGSGASLDRMAERLGESAAGLSRWQGAVRQSGGTAEGLLATVQGLSQQFTQLKETGDAPMRMLLNQLGVSAADAAGRAKPVLTLLTDIGDALEGKGWANSDKFNKLLAAGIDEGTANLLLRSGQERRNLLAQQQEYSEADAKAARQAQERWEKAKLQIERMTQTLVIKLLPAMERIVAATVEFVEWVTPGVARVVDGFESLDKVTDGWVSKLAIALATLKLITGVGLGGAAAAVGKAGAIGAAGAAGYMIGSEISERYIEPNEGLSEAIGEGVARVLAFFGNDEAQQALESNARRKEREAAGVMPAASAVPSGKESRPQSTPTMPPPAVPTATPAVPGSTRAERNYNPGNIEFNPQNKWQGQLPHDPSVEGRFARFATPEAGARALAKLLSNYGARGDDTIEEIIAKFAPASENDSAAYMAALAKDLGVSPSQELNMNDPATVAALVKGISKHEAGRNWLTEEQIMTGVQMAGIGGNTDRSTNLTVGEVKVYTQATDANGVARDMTAALIRQADSGIR